MSTPRVVALGAWLLALLMTFGVTWWAESTLATPGERLFDGLVLAAPQLLLGVLLIRARPWAQGLVGLGLTLGWVFVWARHEAPARGSGETPGARPDIVLITLDTFRADHLGVVGGPVPTPALDGLAASGALFRNAVTTAPLTAPAHASMFTGRTSTEHGLRSNGQRVAAPTVIPQLQAAGWRTGAFLSSRVLDRQTGLCVGFERCEDRWGFIGRLSWLGLAEAALGQGAVERRGDEVVARALYWLSRTSGPKLAWIHLYDAHGPYLPPPMWRPDKEAMREASRQFFALGRSEGSVGDWADDLDRRHVAAQRLLYGAEVRWVDELVGRVLRAIPPETIVIVAGDHGESLGEHEHYFNHGGNLMEPSMRVPMLLRWPGAVPPGSVSDALVSVQDVAGTLLAAAGVPTSLPGLLDARETVEQYASGQQGRTTHGPASGAVRRGDTKVVSDAQGAVTWYDLRADPGELSPLPLPPGWEGDAVAARALAERPAPELDERVRRQLRALGYEGE
ncbi:MAG: sulfatase [Deltaproteobacteria bacterium]|nr:sulfatase [Deltaproteobacteria bacterium]